MNHESSTLLQSCLRGVPAAIVELSSLDANHPVVQQLIDLSLALDPRATSVFRSLPPCDARTAWEIARHPGMESFYRHRALSASIVRNYIRFESDVQYYIDGFWAAFWDQALDLRRPPSFAANEWVAHKSKHWSIECLRKLRAQRWGLVAEFREEIPLPDPPAPPPDIPLLGGRLERLLRWGRLQPHDALFLLLSQSKTAGPTELEALHLNRGMLELTNLLATSESVPGAATISFLRAFFAQHPATLRQVTSSTGQSPRAAIETCVERARNICRDGVWSRHWSEVETRARLVEAQAKEALSGQAEFLVDRLGQNQPDAARLLAWALDRILPLPQNDVQALNVERAARQFCQRLNSVLESTVLSEADAARLSGTHSQQTLLELKSSVTRGMLRTIETHYEKFKRKRKQVAK